MAVVVSTAAHVGIFGLLSFGYPLHGGVKSRALIVRLIPANKPAVLAVPTSEEVASHPQEVAKPAIPSEELESAPIVMGEDNAIELPSAQPDQNRYFFSSELDEPAKPLYLEPLVYPASAFQTQTAGYVRLRVYLNARGEIDSVDVVASSPPGVFEEAALKALLASKFKPATKAGWHVKSQKLIEINFDPRENAEPANKAVP